MGVPATRLLPLIAGAALLLSCARAPQPIILPLPPAPLSMPDEAWVVNTLSTMSLEERVGQLLMLRLPGSFENIQSESMRHAQRMLDEVRVGAFLVEPGSPVEIAQKLNDLQQRSRLPLIIAADPDAHAAGDAPGFTIFPFAAGIGATGDASLAELTGRVLGREARAVGVHWLLAPAADIASSPDRATGGLRTFGSDAGAVSVMVAAFIRGVHAGGALATARHFPGYGEAMVDPSARLATVETDAGALDARELRPFRSAIAAGVSGIMLGHIAVPALTGGSPVPASLSRRIGSDLIRARFGFDGLVITDALDGNALREVDGWSPGEVVVRAIEAGADIVLAPPDPLLGHRALVAAVRSGRIHYTRVDSSVARVLRAKARLGLHRERTVPLDSVAHIVGAPEHGIVAADIAARALTLARDSARLLPLDPRRVRSIAVVAVAAPGHTGAGVALADELRRIYGRGVRLVRVDARSSQAVIDSAAAAAARSDAAILAMYLPPQAATPPVPESVGPLAARIALRAPRTITVAFGQPYEPSRLPGAATYVLAWQPWGEASQRAVARAIAGRAPLPGRLPVELPAAPLTRSAPVAPLSAELRVVDPADVGMDARALLRVDSIITAGIVNGAAPGAALAVGRRGGIVRLRGYGDLDLRRGFPPVTDSTIYDLASLTKVVATTTAAMMLVDQGLIRLDDPVRHYIPEWGGTPVRDRVTIRNLLLHDAGLAPYAALWRDLRGREQFRRRIASLSLEYEPGTRTVYSDFGIILLGLIIEQVSGQPLDAFLRDRLFEPLGLRDTGFNPLQWPYGATDLEGDAEHPRAAPDPLIARIAPTEVDTVFRKRHIRGQVHDENAFALGGVAGHAGLFSSARDLAVFAQMLLNGGFYGGRRYIDPATIALFTRRQGNGNSRALGWDTFVEGGSAGSLFSPSSYGHTGFTGTSIWIDPERELFVILLTNRVNPTRDNQRHVPLRRNVADAVQRAIVDLPTPPAGTPLH